MMCSKPTYTFGDGKAIYIPVIPQFHCLRLALLYVLQVLGCTRNWGFLQDTSFALHVLAELSQFVGWFGIYYYGPPVVMLLVQVSMALVLIGSAGVGELSDDWLVCPRLKWVAPLEGGRSPLEPAAYLVLLFAPLDIDASLLTGCSAVCQTWP